MIQQLKSYELENTDIVNKEVAKTKEKYDILLEEKDRQNQLNREVFDKAEKLLNKNLNKREEQKKPDKKKNTRGKKTNRFGEQILFNYWK